MHILYRTYRWIAVVIGVIGFLVMNLRLCRCIGVVIWVIGNIFWWVMNLSLVCNRYFKSTKSDPFEYSPMAEAISAA